jgi:N-acetylmuramoyl-L-alanine amidase
MKIIIDPGHGGRDSGAVSADGQTMEKDVVLTVSKRVAEILAPYGEIAMTREDDTFLTLSGRARKANQIGADLLSIHCNAGGGTGFEVFTSPGQTLSDPWATAILDELNASFPNRAIRTDLSDGDPDKEGRFTVLTKTRNSAVLVELGFIDTQEGRFFLTAPINQEELAQAIAKATLRHNGIEPKPTQRRPLTLEERIAKLETKIETLIERIA